MVELSSLVVVTHFKEKFTVFMVDALTEIVDLAVARLELDNGFE